MSGFVYFISGPATNSVKIGYSSNEPVARLKALQTGNADELTLLGWYEAAVEEERHWHQKFAPYCIRGEWFRLEGEVEDFILAFLCNYWDAMQPRAAA